MLPQSKDQKQNRDDDPEPQPRDTFRERKRRLHSLTCGISKTYKPQSQDKILNKAECTEQEASMSNSHVIDALGNLDSILKDLKELQESSCSKMFPDITECLSRFNSNASQRGRPILGNVMEALTDPKTHLMGIYGSDDEIKDSVLEKVRRRVHRDKLFDIVLAATVTKKPDMKKIQEDIASQLGLTFNHKCKNERAQELIEWIKIEQKILIVLRDLHKGLDLGELGIPCDCKTLLASTTEEVLSNHMHTQKNFMV